MVAGGVAKVRARGGAGKRHQPRLAKLPEEGCLDGVAVERIDCVAVRRRGPMEATDFPGLLGRLFGMTVCGAAPSWAHTLDTRRRAAPSAWRPADTAQSAAPTAARLDPMPSQRRRRRPLRTTSR